MPLRASGVPGYREIVTAADHLAGIRGGNELAWK